MTFSEKIIEYALLVNYDIKVPTPFGYFYMDYRKVEAIKIVRRYHFENS